MNIKLLAVDMDGTTLNTQHKASSRNLEAFRGAISKGIVLVPASGRMVNIIPEDIFTVKGIRYVISSNGACVFDLQEDKEIYSSHLDYEVVDEIFRIIGPLDLYTEIYSAGKVYMDSACLDRFREAGCLPKYPVEFSAKMYPVDNLLEYVKLNRLLVEKVNLPFIAPEKIAQAGKQIETLPNITLTTSGFDNLEINAAGTSKANALVFLAEKLGIPLSQVMAIGDNHNDVEMLKIAGLGVAMKNGTKQVQEAADYVTADNDHDGVAAAIEKFLLADELI